MCIYYIYTHIHMGLNGVTYGTERRHMWDRKETWLHNRLEHVHDDKRCVRGGGGGGKGDDAGDVLADWGCDP